MRIRTVVIAAVPLLLLFPAGCTYTVPGGPPADTASAAPPSPLARIEALAEAGDYRDALVACVDLSRENPNMPGLPELRNKIMMQLAAQRARDAAAQDESTRAAMVVEIDEKKNLPPSYGISRPVKGETSGLRTPLSQMEAVLRRPVTLHLEDAALNDFILAIGTSENINMITDSDIQTTRKLTVHADKVPLSEILDYVARNLGVAFYLGRDVIWVTQAQPSKEPATPMETRIYRLRKGLSEQELTEGQINIESAITRFVPGIQPSDLLFDPKAHVLIVKGLRADLAKVEDIIASLDVCPPQVLIEARFMMTAVTDLRELGIDWLLSPMVLTTEGGTKPVGLISGNPSYFTPFENQNYGLNLTYQALLTDPMFQAVLHALEMSGNTRTLSVPKVTTVNNRKATITMGEEFRWFEQFDIQSVPSSTTDAGSTIYASRLVPVGSPQTKQLGITLEVTPSVGADLRTITLNLLPSIDEFVRFEIYQTGDTTGSSGTTTNGGSLVKLPIFATRKIDTQVIVQSGETVVMGGLITTSEARDVSRVPVLGAIPLLGGLFRHDTVNERKENLLIFVTATIISERGEQLIATEQISGESRGRALPVTPPVGN